MTETFEERIEKKIDEIHAKVMKKPGRPVGYSPKKAKKEGEVQSPTPSP